MELFLGIFVFFITSFYFLRTSSVDDPQFKEKFEAPYANIRYSFLYYHWES
jgi:hypothetical protein